MKSRTCRKCKCKFIPTAHQVKKSDYTCNVCRRERDKAWRLKRKEEGRPVKTMKMTPEYYKAYKKEYYKKPENKKRHAELMRKYNRDPRLRMKYEARWQAKSAIRSGKLTKQPCSICGDKKVEAHHRDYYKPLDITWLCFKHHREEHDKLRAKNTEEG